VTRAEPPPRDLIYVRTLLGGMQMLLSGTTSAGDFVFEAPEITVDTLEPVIAAYSDLGLRVSVLLGTADMSFLDSLPLDPSARAQAPSEAPPPSVERVLDVTRAAVERWHDPDGLVSIALGPSAPQRCTERFLAATFELAESLDLVWHIHVLETKTQRYAAELGGRSFVELLDERGFLGPRTSVVHGIWLTDRDIELLRDTRTTVIHCLLSNLRLGDGVARLPDLLEAGVEVALGTDGRGCDESLDMYELAKMTALVHKARGDHYTRWPTALRILELAGAAGGRALAQRAAAGRIEPGALGDLVLMPRRSLPFTPLLDPVRQLVYGTPSREVRTVVVGGRVVVENGEILGVDVEDVLARAEQYAPALAATRSAATARLEEIVGELYERAESADVAVDAYIRARTP
jgi:cytosine/adenosine deaminase-related metal-dependent hydrolase